jgi:hypothetical protein
MRYLSRRPYSEPTPVDPDQAWRILSMVNDWVRHAESKLTVTLGAAGVTGGVLYSFVTENRGSGRLFIAVAGLSGAAILTSLVSAMIGLSPVLKLRSATPAEVNPLFFGGIADAHGPSSATYGPALATLSAKPEEIVRHLSQQILINSAVAQRKYWWADRAIQALVINVLALSALTVLSVLAG